MRGRFVVFEGGDASGKTTQARRLAHLLDAVLTREPGGTPLGERVRALLLDPAAAVEPRAEALLMAAARAQHVATVLEPALASGRHVVSDRYAGSSLAYQGYGRGLPVEEVAALASFATGGLQPDLVVLLDVPPEVAARRLGSSLDRFEGEARAFHERVRAGFLAQADADPERWVVVDGSRRVGEVGAEIQEVVEGRLGVHASR